MAYNNCVYLLSLLGFSRWCIDHIVFQIKKFRSCTQKLTLWWPLEEMELSFGYVYPYFYFLNMWQWSCDLTLEFHSYDYIAIISGIKVYSWGITVICVWHYTLYIVSVLIFLMISEYSYGKSYHNRISSVLTKGSNYKLFICLLPYIWTFSPSVSLSMGNCRGCYSICLVIDRQRRFNVFSFCSHPSVKLSIANYGIYFG